MPRENSLQSDSAARITLAFVLLACTPGASSEIQAAMRVADQGQAAATIVVADDAAPSVRHASEELAYFLQEVTGAEFPITNHLPEGQAAIAVGPRSAKLIDTEFSTDGLGQDGIVIRTVGNRLILAGGVRRGTLYAVYTFLEDHVGCHWWAPDEQTIPNRPSLDVPDIDVRYVPAFEYRDVSFFHAQDPDFSVRNKLNGHHHRLFHDDGYHNVRPDFRRGGRRWNWLRSDRWATHAAYTLLPPEVYFQDHPEWYAEVREDQPHGVGYSGYPNADGTGRRPMSVDECNKQRRALCLSNPELRAEAIRNVRWAMSWGFAASLWDLSQIDGMNACRCKQCMDIVNEEGAYSGLRLRFANSIAEQFLRTSGSQFTMLAYHYTRKPPKHARPGENVIVMLVTAYDELPTGKNTEISYAVPLNHERNRSFAIDLTGWVNTGGRIYIYDYAACFSHMIMPYPNLRVYGPNMQLFEKQGVRGYGAEAHRRTPGTEFAELRAWLLARLAWNPSQNTDELISTFCNGYYGAAGRHIVDYINLMHDAVAETDEWLHIGWGYGAKYLAWPFMRDAWQHLAAAESAVADDPELRFRVRVAQLPALFVFLMRWDEFRSQAESSGDDWPLADSPGDVLNQFTQIAERKGVTILDDIFRLPQIRKISDQQ